MIRVALVEDYLPSLPQPDNAHRMHTMLWLQFPDDESEELLISPSPDYYPYIHPDYKSTKLLRMDSIIGSKNNYRMIIQTFLF